MSTNRFAIIQLADTQFGPKHAFESITQFVSAVRDDVARLAEQHLFQSLYLIGAGDLAETGTTEEFDLARQAFTSLKQEIGVDTANVLFVSVRVRHS